MAKIEGCEFDNQNIEWYEVKRRPGDLVPRCASFRNVVSGLLPIGDWKTLGNGVRAIRLNGDNKTLSCPVAKWCKNGVKEN